MGTESCFNCNASSQCCRQPLPALASPWLAHSSCAAPVCRSAPCRVLFSCRVLKELWSEQLEALVTLCCQVWGRAKKPLSVSSQQPGIQLWIMSSPVRGLLVHVPRQARGALLPCNLWLFLTKTQLFWPMLSCSSFIFYPLLRCSYSALLPSWLSDQQRAQD